MRYLSEIHLDSGYSDNQQLISSTFAGLGLVLPEVQQQLPLYRIKALSLVGTGNELIGDPNLQAGSPFDW